MRVFACLTLVATLSAAFAGATSLSGALHASTSARQGAPIPAHPIFSGVWSPSNPQSADKLFAAYVIPIPGGAKLSIDQRPNRITIGIDLPEADLDRLHTRFFANVVYPISRYPVGGNGAGPDRSIEAAWEGEALVIPSFSARDGGRVPVTVTFSLQESHLAMKTEYQLPSAARMTSVTQLFDRAAK